jgi:hypothetical protein
LGIGRSVLILYRSWVLQFVWVMSSFLGFRSGRTGARPSSPSRDAEETAELFDRLRVLERELEREEDGSYSFVDEASRDGSRPREVES